MQTVVDAMATYKLIQDIEAEDKILGPLTLKQFIFALITAFFGYICFLCVNGHVAFLLVLFLPPALISAFFALPIGKDQPTEIWALAKLRFYFKPRKRVWDQSGVKELVTITVPRKVEHILTNGLNQEQVQSRLKVLANTIDSRGWAIKNGNVNVTTQPAGATANQSDRLVNMSSLPQQVPDYDVQASDDMLDATSNPIAKQFDHMINKSTQNRRQQLIDELNDIKPGDASKQTAGQSTDKNSGAFPKASLVPNDYWFLHQPSTANIPANQSMFTDAQIVAPGPGAEDNVVVPAAGTATPDEAAIVAHSKAHNDSQQITYAHMRVIQPLGSQPPLSATTPPPPPRSTDTATDHVPPAAPSAPAHDPAILSLANNNDLNVATLAREAYKAKNPSQDEVVISLH